METCSMGTYHEGSLEMEYRNGIVNCSFEFNL
jgi:hypothetical protein